MGNLKIDSKGKISENINLGNFSYLALIGTNLKSTFSKIIVLNENNKIEKNNLVQELNNNNEIKRYTIMRNSSLIYDGIESQKYLEKISDKKIVKSTSCVFDFLNLFDENNLKEWIFLKDWSSLKLQQKLKFYDKYASHELNLFIFSKDKEFFNFIKIFIENKLEKNLIDYFLLKDERIEQFNSIFHFSNLNNLEKVILAFYYVEINKKNLAEEILKFLENSNESIKKIEKKEYEELFNAIIYSKNIEAKFEKKEIDEVVEMEEEDEDEKNFEISEERNIEGKRRSYKNKRIKSESISFESERRGRRKRKRRSQSISRDRSWSRNDSCSASNSKSISRSRSRNRSYSRSRSRESENEIGMVDARDISRDPYSEKYIQKRKNLKQGYKPIDKTNIFEEMQYYDKNDENILNANSFWVDLCRFFVNQDYKNKPFLSENFIFCKNNLVESLSALSFLDLPLKENINQKAFIIFSKRFLPAEMEKNNDIWINQIFLPEFK